jgi:LPS sulfotransferase NodH
MRVENKGLRPLLLLFPARSGSTLLMQLLGTSPKIVFDRVPPFEQRFFALLMRWAWQLADAQLQSDEWTLDRLITEPAFPGNPIEPPPFAMPAGFASDSPQPLWHTSFLTAWREFSLRASSSEISCPGRDPAPLYYAEKSRALFRYSLQDVGIEPEVIYLLRDPRDVQQSIFSFNEKRGTKYFSAVDGESAEAFAYKFIEERKLRLRMLIEMVPDDPHATIVRYEDMATDLPLVARRLSDKLGVALDAQQVLDQQREFRDHMSSADPEASVQRWRREMPENIQQMFRQRLGDELEQLGYEV